ncbi:glycosyltransferase 61 family protein [Helicobacter sp. 23-1045]
MNENEVREILEQKYGFKTLFMEEVSFKDKINYLSRAKVLLSVDGTSVMNYGYMKAGSKAIALRPFNMAEYPIENIFGVEFLPIICEIDKKTEKDTDHLDGFIGSWWASNLIVDIKYLEDRLSAYGICPIN